MTDEEWSAVSLLLARGWKGEWGGLDDRAYRILLDGYDTEQLVTALRKLAVHGHFSRPTVPEIVQAIEYKDRPTGAEFFDLLYGAGGVIRASLPSGGRYDSEARMLAARDEAREDRAWDIDPMLGSFVHAYGVRRLAMLQIDGEHAELVRRDLLAEWEEHVERNAHRDAVALAAGRRRDLARGPRKSHFEAALAAGQPQTEENT